MGLRSAGGMCVWRETEDIVLLLVFFGSIGRRRWCGVERRGGQSHSLEFTAGLANLSRRLRTTPSLASIDSPHALSAQPEPPTHLHYMYK